MIRMAAILAMTLAAGAPAERPYNNHGIPGQDPRRFREFRDPGGPLTRYLAEVWHRPKPGTVQHFCIVAYDGGKMEHGDDHYVTAYVHWIEGRHLIMWEPYDDDMRNEGLAMTRRDWDFRTDVKRVVDWSTQPTDWTISWDEVNEYLRACRRVGQQVAIAVPPAGSRAGRAGLWKPIPIPKMP